MFFHIDINIDNIHTFFLINNVLDNYPKKQKLTNISFYLQKSF